MIKDQPPQSEEPPSKNIIHRFTGYILSAYYKMVTFRRDWSDSIIESSFGSLRGFGYIGCRTRYKDIW